MPINYIKKATLLTFFLLVVILGCKSDLNQKDSMWSLEIGMVSLGGLKTPNHLFIDNSIVLYKNHTLIKKKIDSTPLLWEYKVDKKIYTTHIIHLDKEILICGFHNDESYIYLVNFETGAINSIDTFPSVIESIYQLDSSNLIIHQQNLSHYPYVIKISAYNFKSQRLLWELENTGIFSQPYIDSNYLVIPKNDTSVICIHKKSGKLLNFPIASEKVFGFIEKLNDTPKWQLFNLIDGKIDTVNSWEYKFIINNSNIFATKKLDNKLFQISLASGKATPLLEFQNNILYSSSYGSYILCYFDNNKGVIVNPLTKEINPIELKSKLFLNKNGISLYKNRFFYYSETESPNGIGYKISGELVTFPNNKSN